MMVTINFTKFRQNAKEYFDKVEGGETVRIVRHGKVIAEICPPQRHELTWAEDFEPLIIPGVSLSADIIQERREGR